MSKRGDRLSVMLFSLAAFLCVLALLGTQLSHGARATQARVEVLRKIYRTTVLERVIGARPGPSGTSVSQTVAGSSGSTPLVATRTS
jgi:hypothetical protein